MPVIRLGFGKDAKRNLFLSGIMGINAFNSSVLLGGVKHLVWPWSLCALVTFSPNEVSLQPVYIVMHPLGCY